MAQIVAITEAITSLADAENRFGFVRVEDGQFFREWYEGLRFEQNYRYIYYSVIKI